jgi:hypothetical protein
LLPPEFLLSLSDTPGKDRLLRILQEAQQRQMEMEMAKRNASSTSGGASAQPSGPGDALPPPPGATGGMSVNDNISAGAPRAEEGIL